MGQVVFFRSRYFVFRLLLELQDVGKESQDKNTTETRIVIKVLDQKDQLQ